MKLNSVSGVTHFVKDLKKSVEFYEALGFRIGKEDETHVTCYVNWFWVDLVAQDTVTEADLKPVAEESNRGAGSLLHIKVDSIQECYEGVLAGGMNPDGEPRKRPSGSQEFMLTDPDGYRIIFFEKK